jgi:glycine hydroxymethyltransferase
MSFITSEDPTVAALIEKERHRQESTLNLIAAENTAPAAVLEALGSSFNNKTAEGYPGRRYHTGCQVTDEMEQLAVERAKALFGAGHANVQPHSGVNANLAVYG